MDHALELISVAQPGPSSPHPPLAKKLCKSCQRHKPVKKFGKPGSNLVMKTCLDCRVKARKTAISHPRKRKRTSIAAASEQPVEESYAAAATTYAPAFATTLPTAESVTAVTAPTPAVVNPAPAPVAPATFLAGMTSNKFEAFTTSVASLSRLLEFASASLPQELIVTLSEELNYDLEIEEAGEWVKGYLRAATRVKELQER